LIYVGSGQYYDPATGRFLTRFANPGAINPYVPMNPLGALLGPAALLILLQRRRKKSGKYDHILIGLVLLLTFGMGVAACTGEPPYTPEPPQPPPLLEDTPIIDAPWVDEMGDWNQAPNSCGPAALYMFLVAEGVTVEYQTLMNQLSQERPGGYDGYCCSQGWGVFPTPTPGPQGQSWCNEACTSAEALASVASKYYGLSIEFGDNWTRDKIHQKLMSGHPVVALVRSEFTTDHFGHFVLIRGFSTVQMKKDQS
jgi:hypothetical protein